MNTLTVKAKLLLTTILTILLFIGFSLISNHIRSTSADLSDTLIVMKNAEINMLMLRRHEKDFIARQHTKYTDKFTVEYTLLKTNLKTINEKLLQHNINHNNQLPELKSLLADYHQNFITHTQHSKKIGYDQDSGLKAQLRSSIKNVEEQINLLGNDKLRADILQVRRNEKDFLMRQDLKYGQRHAANLLILVQSISDSTINNIQKKNLNLLINRYAALFTDIVQASVKKGLTPQQGLLGEIRESVHATEAVFHSLQTSIQLSIKELNQKALLFSQVATLLIAIVLAVLLIFVSNSISKRLNNINHHLAKIANGNGDLTVQLNSSGNDEISSLAHSFNAFVIKLSTMFGDISQISQSLNQSSIANSESSQKSSNNAKIQLDITKDVQLAMSEMVAANNDIEENIVLAAQAAEQAKHNADEGKKTSLITQQSVKKLDSTIEKAVLSIENLEENSASIETVLTNICEIADQTNLLALNAAIEAARAGESGRGFAVVADEVRTLALRTQESAAEIQQLIELLQNGIHASSSAMKKSRVEVQHGLEHSILLLASLEEITNSAELIFQMNSQIATSSEEQSVISEQIRSNINTISEKALETADSTQALSLSNSDVQVMSKDLQSIVAGYTL